MDSIPVDKYAEEQLLEFNDATDLPLNGEFQRQGYKYTNALRNIKTAGFKIFLAIMAGGILLIIMEINQVK
jgi:hypothetical protein